MHQRYIIIGLPRSGTTVVHLLLRGHPNIAALNDELEIAPLFTQGISTFTHGNDLPEEKRAGVRALFDAIAGLTADEHTAIRGAKVTCANPYMARQLVGALKAHFPDMKVILTIREDLVAQYGSLMSAKRSGRWHSWYKGANNQKVGKRRLSRWLFIRYLDNCLSTLEVVRALYQSHDVYESRYEDLLQEPELVYERLFSFLEVPAVHVDWLESKKVMPHPSTYIRNYGVLEGLMVDLQDKHQRGGLSPALRRLVKGWAMLHRLLNVRGLFRSWRTRRSVAARKNASVTSTEVQSRLFDKLTSV